MIDYRNGTRVLQGHAVEAKGERVTWGSLFWVGIQGVGIPDETCTTRDETIHPFTHRSYADLRSTSVNCFNWPVVTGTCKNFTHTHSVHALISIRCEHSGQGDLVSVLDDLPQWFQNPYSSWLHFKPSFQAYNQISPKPMNVKTEQQNPTARWTGGYAS